MFILIDWYCYKVLNNGKWSPGRASSMRICCKICYVNTSLKQPINQYLYLLLAIYATYNMSIVKTFTTYLCKNCRRPPKNYKYRHYVLCSSLDHSTVSRRAKEVRLLLLVPMNIPVPSTFLTSLDLSRLLMHFRRRVHVCSTSQNAIGLRIKTTTRVVSVDI
jgi:hypothetical protein